MKNTITIAIPVYNGEKYISEALMSIVDQTRKVDQILICDNHSTDNTINIIERFIKEHLKMNIRLHQNGVNIGVDPNFNKCMELCDTQFLLILGSDDRLKTDAIEKQIKLFEKVPDLALVGGLYESIDNEGKTTGIPEKKDTIIFNKGEILEFMRHTGFYMQHSTITFNMKCTRRVGFYDTRYIANDERLNVTHLLKYPIAQMGEILAEARFHDEQATNDEIARYRDKILHFKANLDMAKLESSPERILDTKNAVKKWIGNQCIAVGRKNWKNHNKKGVAIKYWLFGIKQNPSIIFKSHFWKIIAVSLLNR